MRFSSICQLTAGLAAMAALGFFAAPSLIPWLSGPDIWNDSHTLLARNIGLVFLVSALGLFMLRAVRPGAIQQGLAAGLSIVLVLAGGLLAYTILTGQIVALAMPELLESLVAPQVADSAESASSAPGVVGAQEMRLAAIQTTRGMFWAVVAVLGLKGVLWGVSIMPGESRRHHQWR
ncbi:MAG: hypothetical protein ACRBC3_22140 [Burkholderiaceae bacterium]